MRQRKCFDFNLEGSTSATFLIPIENFKIDYTKNLGVFKISYKFQASVASGMVIYSLENKTLDPSLPYFSKPMNKSKQDIDLGILAGDVSIKLILYGVLNDTVETTVYTLAISKIGI